MALGASSQDLGAVDAQIAVRPPLSRRGSIQEELYGPGACLHCSTLRPPSASTVTSDASMTEVHFQWIDGQLTPLKDGPVNDTESSAQAHLHTEDAEVLCGSCNETAHSENHAHDLTAANLAKLGDKARRLMRKDTSRSTAKSLSPKSTKSNKSNGSNTSKASSSWKAIGHVMRAVQAFQRPLRQCHHAHRGRYECQYCFEDLDVGHLAVLVGADGLRSCEHLYHQECCAAMQERANKHGVSCKPRCPSCRKAFTSFVKLPDPISETEMWFDALDFTKCGKVHKNDIMDHLMAVLPVKTALRDTLAPAPERINLASCRALIDRLKTMSSEDIVLKGSKTKRRQPPALPNIQKQTDWFTFWDIYEDGALNRWGATRALMKSLRGYDKLLMRAAIDDVWPEVIVSCGDDEMASIGKEGIFKPNSGLLDRATRKVQAAQHWKLLKELTPM